jgi:integrator complex subunit 2
MNFKVPVLPHVFQAIKNLDIRELSKCNAREIRPILPCLARITLLPAQANTQKFQDDRKEILALLLGIETVNSIVALLSIDFHALEIDVKKEQQIRFVYKN